MTVPPPVPDAMRPDPDWDAEHRIAEPPDLHLVDPQADEDRWQSLPADDQAAPEGAEQTDADFWERRPLFRWCRDMGRARLLSPDALLGYMFARIRVELGHQVLIPAMVGAPQSLNLGVIQCGRSGGGKTAVREAVDDQTVWSDTIPVTVLGTGEGLIDVFARTEESDGHKYLIWLTRSALLFTDEIDMLEALNARRGGTLMSTMRSAISGTRIGFGYRGNGTQLPPRSYSLAIVIAAQPTRMQWLLDEADAGTPQRFLWFTSDFPDMPRPDEILTEPGAPKLTLPPLAGPTEFVFPDQVRAEVRQARYDNRAGDKGEMYSHLMLTRCKVAALLAASEGRINVTGEDWTDAGAVIDRSQKVIAATTAALAAEAGKALERQGRADGHRQVAADRIVSSAVENRVALRIGRHVHSHATEYGCVRKCIRAGLASRDRQSVEAAIERAVENDWIVPVTRPHPSKHDITVTYYQRGRVTP